jgi:hypothetical protein
VTDADLKAAVRNAADAWRAAAAVAADPVYSDEARQAQLRIAKQTRATLTCPDEDDAEWVAICDGYIAALDAFIACCAPQGALS